MPHTTASPFRVPEVADLHDAALTAALQSAIDGKTKPLGSLGRIEWLAQRIGAVLGTATPELREPQMLVCAGDHGLAARGVSVSVLARQHGIALTVVDCGVREAVPEQPGLLSRRLGPGTQDALDGPAMSAEQCEQALAHGADVVRGLPGNALLLGEMGIANTSVASLLLARLGGLEVGDVTGAGTGLNADAVLRKIGVLRAVLQRHAQAREPLAALAAFGGFEIATLAGAALQAAAERRVILVDGFIASSAVLVASKLRPHLLQRCVFAHRSGERGHALMLAHLRADPLLDLGLRLGEGSGAALAWPLLQSACALLNQMASFASAGVSQSAIDAAPAARAEPELTAADASRKPAR